MGALPVLLTENEQKLYWTPKTGYDVMNTPKKGGSGPKSLGDFFLVNCIHISSPKNLVSNFLQFVPSKIVFPLD